MTYLTLVTSFILLSISVLHFYWAFGGDWGIEHTIPVKFTDTFFSENNKSKIMLATIVVAIGLLAFSIIFYSNFQNIVPFVNADWIVNLTRIIGGIFLVRAIGDFNLFGLFKKKSNSKFTRMDSLLYVPLCLSLAISSVLITF